MRIVEDDLSGPEIAALLREHAQGMYETSPPDSVHTLSLDALRSPDVIMWSAWDDSILLGCGALKSLDTRSGEIKSMRTADAHLGRGVGRRILQHIVGECRDRGYQRLFLETGSTPDFEPARRLYRKAGFSDCGPFANYREDPFSRFMALDL